MAEFFVKPDRWNEKKKVFSFWDVFQSLKLNATYICKSLNLLILQTET